MNKLSLLLLPCLLLTSQANARPPIPPSLFNPGSSKHVFLQGLGELPYKEPRLRFVTIEDIDQHYRRLLRELKRSSYIYRGTSPFILNESWGMYPELPNKNSTDQLNVQRVCPLKDIEGVDDPHKYIDYALLKLIKEKKRPAPLGKRLLVLNETGLALLPPSVSEYQKAAKMFARNFNAGMFPLCMAKAGVLDVNHLVNHQSYLNIVGDTLFLIDAFPLQNPRKPEMSTLEQKTYQTYLDKILSKRDPSVDAKSFISQGEVYFLSKMPMAALDVRYPNRLTPQPRTGRGQIYAFESFGISHQVETYLSKVCPRKLIEGDYRIGGHFSSKIQYDYAKQWNQTVLPVCMRTAYRMFPQEMAWIGSYQQWNRLPQKYMTWREEKPLPSYRYTFQASNLENGQALQVTVKNHKIIDAFRVDNKKHLNVNQIPSIETLFQTINKAITGKVRVNATYSAQYGNPESIVIPKTPTQEKTTYSINDLQPIR